MAATATKSKGYPVTDTTQSTQIIRGTIAFAGNYPTGGDILDLSHIGAQSRKPPVRVFVYEQPPAGTSPVGWEFVYCPGTTQANGRLVLEGTGAAAGALGQLAAGAYPVFPAGSVVFEAVFLTGI